VKKVHIFGCHKQATMISRKYIADAKDHMEAEGVF
jgi:hypothetical protein